MRHLYLALALTLALISQQSLAYDKVGVGIGLGGSSGVSLYAREDASRFVQGLVALDTYSGSFALTGDYAFSFPNALHEVPLITPYYGFGAVAAYIEGWYLGRRKLYADGSAAIGGRIPLGIQLEIPKTPLQISLEVAPSILIVPFTTAFFDGLLAVRVVF
jgi:hypothetical protein